MKFDVVVGNPPYLKGKWVKFLEKAIQHSTHFVAQINPDGTGNFSSTSAKIENIYLSHGVQLYQECTKSFPSVNSGKIIYALLDITKPAIAEALENKSISGRITKKIVEHPGPKIESILSKKRSKEFSSAPRFDHKAKGRIKNLESVTKTGPIFKYIAINDTTIVNGDDYWFTNRYFGRDTNSPIIELSGYIGISHNILAIKKLPGVSLNAFRSKILTPAKIVALSVLRGDGFDTSPRHLRQVSFVDDIKFNFTQEERDYIEANVK